MDEDLQLPPTPHYQQNDLRLPKPPAFPRLNSSLRKRSYRSDDLQDDDALSVSIHTSSDPALFSSDETPDAENYSGGKRRKKKTYAGTWWGERPRASSRALSSSGSGRKFLKGKFTRNFDSGIFMCSDDGSTELSSDGSFGEASTDQQTRRREEAEDILGGGADSFASSKFASHVLSPQLAKGAKRPVLADSRQQQVCQLIRRCLDDSKEDIDLSSIQLDTLPPEIRELATMVKDDPANPHNFDSLVARPRLYLSNNLFRQFPTPILELSNLRLLSLRRNKLTRIPPGIRNLIKLETLNIAGNKLESLPTEILDLMTNHRLIELQSEPNPWYECLVTKSIENPTPIRKLVAKHDSNPTTFELTGIWQETEPNITQINVPQRTPSLSELVLRQLSRLNTSKRDLSEIMPEDAPPSIPVLLKDLYEAQGDGDRRCNWCQRLYVRPAAMWIEFWTVRRGVREDGIHDDGEGDPSQAVGQGLELPFEVGVCGQCAEPRR